jgi:hypothetical protein
MNNTTSPITTEITVTPKIRGCLPNNANIRTFSIAVKPNPTVNVKDTTVCSGATVSVPLTGVATKYVRKITASNITGVNTGTATVTADASGDATLSFGVLANATTAPRSATIEVTPYYTDECTGTAKTFTITVAPAMSGGTIGASQTVCYNTAPSKLTSTVDASGGQGTNIYQWESKTGGGSWTAVGSSNSKDYQPGALTATTLYRRKYTNDCGNVYSNEITVTVNPTPTLSSTTTPPAICSGTAFSYTAISTILETTFTWTRAAVSGISESAVTDGTGATISETLTNTTTNAIDVIYKITLIANGCASMPQDVTVTVNALPDAGTITGASEVCLGSTITMGTTVPGGAWKSEDTGIATVDNAGTVTGVSVGNVDIWYTVSNSSGCRDSVSYTVTVKAEDSFDYPDIRLRLCPSIGTVDLLKYLGENSVSWSGPFIQSSGELDASALQASSTYTLTYTVVSGCLSTVKTRKVYIKMLRNNESIHDLNTITICHEFAETLNINRILGMESGGTLGWENDVNPYITQTSHGGTVFNGKQYYGDATLVDGKTTVTFTYTPADCLSGKTYRIVIVLTSQL